MERFGQARLLEGVLELESARLPSKSVHQRLLLDPFKFALLFCCCLDFPGIPWMDELRFAPPRNPKDDSPVNTNKAFRNHPQVGIFRAERGQKLGQASAQRGFGLRPPAQLAAGLGAEGGCRGRRGSGET